MKLPSVLRWIVAGGLLFAAGLSPAQQPAPTKPVVPDDPAARPAWRELWVPSDALAPVLNRYPRAVSLTRDEWFSLWRDAHADDPTAPDALNPPPERAVLRQARFDGWLVLGPDARPQVRVEAQMEVEVLADTWAEVPLGLPGIALGTAEIDAGTSAGVASGPGGLRRAGGADGPASLQIQGRGVHRLRLGFVLPVTTGPDGSSVVLPGVAGVGEFILHLPAGTRADSSRGCAVQAEGPGVVARVALARIAGEAAPRTVNLGNFVSQAHLTANKSPAAIEPDRLRWRTTPPAPAETSTLLQSGRVDIEVDAAKLTLRQEIALRPAAGRLPKEVRIALPHWEGAAVHVEGAGLARWDLGADGLRVELAPTGGDHDEQVAFTVIYEMPHTLFGSNRAIDNPDLGPRPAPGGRTGLTIVPEVLKVVGAHRVTGALVVRHSPEVIVERIVPGAALASAAGGTFTAAEENAPNFVAGFTLADLLTEPVGPAVAKGPPPLGLEMTMYPARARFSVDADARADFQADGVHIARTLTFQVEEGEVFAARVKLPPGETLLSLHADDKGREPDWRQEGGDLLLDWHTGLPTSSKTVLVLDARAELVAPKPGAPTDFALGAATVPGAERLTGYVALASAPAFRLVTVGGEERLERRDGRTTPVRGDVAWFYRDDFKLALRVERRAAEMEARFTGYALPLAGAVEIHAQIDYHFLYSGVETVKIRVPRESAEAFSFTGAHIAERRRDDDVWTIRFQGEQTGEYALGVQATIPAPADKDDAQRFHFRLPVVTPLESARWSGVWAVEANADTEIGFTTKGVNEVDALHAPPLAGYQPRRRIIGVFEFLGGATDVGIDLAGVRHPAAGGVGAVVDRLDLETTVSTSGVSRHLARVHARTVSDGFFNLYLPPGATLWSLTLDGEPVKPVGGGAGWAGSRVRVELPGGRKPENASMVVVVYETPDRAWTDAGRRTVFAPRFDEGVPVLRSHWTLRVPDGYDYRFAEAPSNAHPPEAALGDLLVPRLARSLGRAVQWVFYYPTYWNIRRVFGGSGIADPRAVESELPAWMAERLKRDSLRRMPSEVLAVQAMTADEDVYQHAMTLAPRAEALPQPQTEAKVIDKLKPKFINRVEELKSLLSEAQQLSDSGRFDLAFKRYEQVLALDPSNDAARRGEERIELARKQTGNDYANSRGHLLSDVDKDWESNTRRRAGAIVNDARINGNPGTAALNRKLQSIIIPHIEFRSTTINDAVEFLRQESVRLDTASPENERGINIFLKLPAPMPLTANTNTPTLSTNGTRISLTLNHIPLLEALRYAAQQANLKVKVDEYAVSLVPVQENTDVLLTREFKVSPDFIRNLTKAAEASGGMGAAALGSGATAGSGGDVNVGRDVTGVGSVTINRQSADEFLKSAGMQFPPGSSATYLPSTGKLIIRNTQENLDLMAEVGEGAGKSDLKPKPPTPVLDQRQSAAGVPGLLPLRLDLPANGQSYEFESGGEPGTLGFHYADWSVAARWRWVWLSLGALGFLFGAAGWAHPWRRTLYAVLTLTFFPLILAPSATVACNALLAGWLWTVAGWCVTRFLLRRKPLVVAAVPLLCGTMFLLASPAQAEPRPSPVPTPAPPLETLIVPYDTTKPAARQEGSRYYLPYERFLLLWDAAKHHRRPTVPEPPPGGERYTLGASRYDARLDGDTLAVAATLDLQTSGEGWVGVPLGFETNRVGTMTLDGAPAALAADGALWIGSPGAHRVAVTLRVPTGTVVAGTRLAWNVPPTVATLVTLLVPRADLRADIRGGTPGGGEVEEIVPDGRRLTASLGGTGSVEVTFRDAPVPAPAAGQPALARVEARLTASARQESVSATLGLSFPGNTQDHFTVLLDRSLTVTGLDAPDIREWHLTTGGDRQTLEIVLDAPARDGYRLTLTADRPLAALPAERRTFPLVSALATRVEQTVALLTEGAVEFFLPDGPPAGARRVETTAPDRGRLFAAFAGDGKTAVIYSVRAANAKRTAHINYLYQVGRSKIELAASVRLVPGAAGEPLLTADLRLPAGFAVQAVVGDVVRQWWREGDLLSLRFQPGGTANEATMLVYLVRQFDPVAARLALGPLTAVGFAETDGEAVVAADRSYKVGLTLPAGVRTQDLSEINAATAAGEFQVKAPLERQRAFRYRGTGFDVLATLESQPARWQAHWVTQATVRDGALSLETHVNVEALQGAVDTLEFSLPPGLGEARVNGPDVRETVVSDNTRDRRKYRVIFQNPLYGGTEAGFTINLEIPLGADNRATLPDLALTGDGGRAAGGYILVENASSGEMTLDPRGLDPALEKDVPFLPAEIVAGTRFFRAAPGLSWSLGVRVTTLEKTAGRAALVAYAEMTSTLRTDGEEWHRATYRLQNRRLQFLPVELPPGTELVGARVAGESVRVDVGAGGKNALPSLLVPLVKTRPGELSYDVEIIYRRPAPGPADARRQPFFGRWQLQDPRLPGIPVEKTLWDVYLPANARLLNTGGNLEPVVTALSVTEKLESTLSDLRDLSATYRSRSASQEERQLAFDNYNALSVQVTEQAKAVPSQRGDTATDNNALFKQANTATQIETVNRKQQSILSTLDSLNSANKLVVQDQITGTLNGTNTYAGATVITGGTVLNNGIQKGSQPFDGFINYGSPIQTNAGNQVNSNAQWRDNRGAVGKVRPTAPNTSAIVDFASQKEGREHLALNDSVTVDLPILNGRVSQAGDDKQKDADGAQSSKRLSTARAADKSEQVAQASATPVPPGEIPAKVTGSMKQFGASWAAPKPVNAPAPEILSLAGVFTDPQLNVAARATGTEEKKVRAGTPRSEGHISLAVNFPLEGQVYHFKKIKDEARLSLWSVQPARFARLGWLALLLAGVAAVWAVRRGWRRMRNRRASGVPVTA